MPGLVRSARAIVLTALAAAVGTSAATKSIEADCNELRSIFLPALSV